MSKLEFLIGSGKWFCVVVDVVANILLNFTIFPLYEVDFLCHYTYCCCSEFILSNILIWCSKNWTKCVCEREREREKNKKLNVKTIARTHSTTTQWICFVNQNTNPICEVIRNIRHMPFFIVLTKNRFFFVSIFNFFFSVLYTPNICIDFFYQINEHNISFPVNASHFIIFIWFADATDTHHHMV